MANPFYPPRANRTSAGSGLGASGEAGYGDEPPRPFDPHRAATFARGAGSSGTAASQQQYYHPPPQAPQQQRQEDYYAGAAPAGGARYADPYETAPSPGGYYAYPPAPNQPLHEYLSTPTTGPTPTSAAPFLGRADSDDPTRRPDTPGIYPDRAPTRDKLTPAQLKIADSFPKDLDRDGGTMFGDMKSMVRDWRSWVKWKYTHYYVGCIIIIVVVALMTLYHKQIVDWLTPLSLKVKSVSWGWIIVVAILFVISFPPLFGHEIVGVLCGVVYGLWVGFGIFSLGTVLGELGNFVAFKWCFKRQAEKVERKSITYACMAHITREGGFGVILLARLSAIPGHVSTAIFATIGMNIWVFTAAAVITLPKQLAVVYLGVALGTSSAGGESTQSKIVKWAVIVITVIVTILAALYLHRKMDQARPQVQKALRQRRFTMLTEARASEAADGGVWGYGDTASPLGSATKLYGAGAAGVYSRDDFSERIDMPPQQVQGAPRAGQQQRSSGGWSRWANKGSAQEYEGDSRDGGANGISMSMLHSAAPLGRAPSQDTLSSDAAHESRPALAPVPAASYGRSNPEGYAYSPEDERVEYMHSPQPQREEQRQEVMQQQQQRGARPPPAPSSAAAAALKLAPPDTRQHYQQVSNVGSVYSLPAGSEDLGRGNAHAATQQAAPHAAQQQQHYADSRSTTPGAPPSYASDEPWGAERPQQRAAPTDQRWSLHDGQAF